MEFDVFISHATEDKHEIARPLYTELERHGVKVWYDEAILKPGDSLSKCIDFGLSKARYGIVILSENFFLKGWPQYELSGLTIRQVNGENIILPVWHKVTVSDVVKFSPPLANLVAYNTSVSSIEEIAEGILATLNPRDISRPFVQCAKNSLSNIDKSEFRGYGYDYFPGGLRAAYFHLLTFTSYKQVKRWFGQPIYLNYSDDMDLDLYNERDFGRYNPKFVEWLDRNMSVVLSNAAFVGVARNVFKKYFSVTAIAYYKVYFVLAHYPREADYLHREYLQHLNSGTLPPKFYYGMNRQKRDRDTVDPYGFLTDIACQSDVNGNLVGSAMYFWLRRRIDKTDTAFIALLTKIVGAFDSSGQFYADACLRFAFSNNPPGIQT